MITDLATFLGYSIYMRFEFESFIQSYPRNFAEFLNLKLATIIVQIVWVRNSSSCKKHDYR